MFAIDKAEEFERKLQETIELNLLWKLGKKQNYFSFFSW